MTEEPPTGGSKPAEIPLKQLLSPTHLICATKPQRPQYSPTRTINALIPCFKTMLVVLLP